MVAQFQSLLSPFIVLFTVPLAFTGGLIGLLLMNEPLSVMGMMGFVVLQVRLSTTVLCSWIMRTSSVWGGLQERKKAPIATEQDQNAPDTDDSTYHDRSNGKPVRRNDLSSQMSKGQWRS